MTRTSIKQPIEEIIQAWNYLNEAVDAHLLGDTNRAKVFFKKADMRAVWDWVNPAWSRPDLNVIVRTPAADSRPIPKEMRDSDRLINKKVRAEVLNRDGYRCRYCGIPVIDAKIRKLAHRLYPDTVPWNSSDPRQQHAGFQCFWLQYDHVEPHSHGGLSTVQNVVISCALCNYGKDKYTLRQLELEDPRSRVPKPSAWDGLERFNSNSTTGTGDDKQTGMRGEFRSSATNSQAFFFPGSRVSSGYLYVPNIFGKERWFKLGPDVIAEYAIREGTQGHRLFCNPKLLRRRGIHPDSFLESKTD